LSEFLYLGAYSAAIAIGSDTPLLPGVVLDPLRLFCRDYSGSLLFLTCYPFFRFRRLPKGACSNILKRMEVHFTPEQEARLAQIAANAGTDAERLVKNAALRLLEGEVGLRADVPRSNGELPLWHLGGVGPLHRRDIYDDAR
jgi:hypothetical protein